MRLSYSYTKSGAAAVPIPGACDPGRQSTRSLHSNSFLPSRLTPVTRKSHGNRLALTPQRSGMSGVDSWAREGTYSVPLQTGCEQHSATAYIVNSASFFHPAVADWFDRSFPAPTPAQAAAWPSIQSGRHTLIAAPTGSGKTLAAFLAAIDDLLKQGLAGELKDETQVIYVSPLKALSNDIQRNLEAPLAGIRDALQARG